jgi:hypothetical protein
MRLIFGKTEKTELTGTIHFAILCFRISENIEKLNI